MVIMLDDYNFQQGELVQLNDDIGRVNFIGELYITITTNRWKDDNYMRGYRETNLLVYPHDWGKLIFITRNKIKEENDKQQTQLENSSYKSQEHRYSDPQ